MTFPSATAFEDMAAGEVVERCVGLHLGSCIPVTLQVGMVEHVGFRPVYAGRTKNGFWGSIVLDKRLFHVYFQFSFGEMFNLSRQLDFGG